MYWPTKKDEILKFQTFQVRLEIEEMILPKAIYQRNIIIETLPEGDMHETKELLSLQHLHIVCWPDHFIPEEETGYKMIELVSMLIDETRKTSSNESTKDFKSPILIHCR